MEQRSLSTSNVVRFPKSSKKCYNLRRPKGSSAFFVLLLNFLVFSYQFNATYTLLSLITPELSKADPWVSGFLSAILAECLPNLLYPFAGWLADAKYGRYKVMRAGLWIKWMAAVLLLSISVFRSALNLDSFKNDVMLPLVAVLYIISSVGTACFQVNIIPFGIDQMEDGSAEELSSFVYWYYWTRNINFGVVVQFVITAIFSCGTHLPNHSLIIAFVQVMLLTIAVCLDILLSGRLNKDPKIHNPIYKVKEITAFVIKYSQPVGRRRALTYISDEPPARTDFAKKSYGGFFDDDDVEEVVTFWRMIAFLATVGFSSFMSLSVSSKLEKEKVKKGTFNYSNLFEHMKTLSPCLSEYISLNMVSTITYTLCIPIFEFLIYPFFRNYVPRINARIGIGMLVMIIGFLWLLVTDLIGHSFMNNENHHSSNNICMFYQPQQQISMSSFTLIPVIVIVTIGELLVFIPTLEFICAQSPYSMRGLIIGMLFFMYGISAGFVGLVMMAVALGFKAIRSHTTHMALSCEVSYTMVIIVIGLIGFVLYAIVSKWYKNRQRGGQTDINHQTVLEEHFERHIRQRNNH